MIVGQVRGSSLTLTIVNLSWHAMEVSIQDTPWPYGEASQPRLWQPSGRPSHQAWLLAAVVPATVTNGKCLEEVKVKILKLDHHASAAAGPFY